MVNTLLAVTLGVLLVTAPSDSGRSRRTAFAAEDVLARSRAAYAALTSYADSGTVLDEKGGYIDRSTFRTLFTRDPHQLLLEFRALASEYPAIRVPLNNHVVLWMEDGALQAWSSSAQSHETYTAESGQQVNALKHRAGLTSGISVVVPSHLYGKSGLASAVQATEEAEADGFETVNGRLLQDPRRGAVALSERPGDRRPRDHVVDRRRDVPHSQDRPGYPEGHASRVAQQDDHDDQAPGEPRPQAGTVPLRGAGELTMPRCRRRVSRLGDRATISHEGGA